MKRRRRLVFASALAMVACAIGVACSFPSVTFSGSAGAEGGAESSASEGGPDARGDNEVTFEGGDPDAIVAKDAGMKVDAAGCVMCDCDGDGYRIDAGGCDASGGGALGGGDCDDTDTRTHPGQGYLVEKAELPRNGDWNCVNGVEKFYMPNIKCSALAFGANCDATYGFSDDPPCGVAGTHVQCKSVGTPPLNLDGKCVVGSQDLMTIQACR